MTIDKSINVIEKRILPIYDNDTDHKSLVMAITTMRKYQKIADIIDNRYGKPTFITLDEVIKVVEDDSDECKFHRSI